MSIIFEEKVLDDAVSATTGTDVMNGLLLSQYQNSDNLKEYYSAFINELDILYEQAERVYLGRFLEYAEGVQLDILGIIVGLSRELVLDAPHFGFFGSVGSGTFESDTETGTSEVFKSVSPAFNILQLDDTYFRRAIRAKGLCNSPNPQSVDNIYRIVFATLGFVPSTVELIGGDRKITLELMDDDIDSTSANLVEAMAEYFTPAGYQFVLNLI